MKMKTLTAQSTTGRQALAGWHTIIILAALGVVLVAIIGFAGGDVLHSAAHDLRHANGFPCH